MRLARYPSLVENLKRCLHGFDKEQSTSKNYNILDIGVGYGRTYVYANAAGITNKFNWHGIDLRRFPSKDRAGGDEWDIKIANIEEGIPYPDNIFDIVVAEQILEHLKNVPFAVSELERVTKKGGILRFLENYEWWYKFNCKTGQSLSAFCVEIQMLIEKIK